MLGAKKNAAAVRSLRALRQRLKEL